MYFNLLICLLLINLASSSIHVVEDNFNSWKLKYNKQYKTKSNEENAIKNWNNNNEIISKINNNSKLSWKAEMNKFGDLTSDEFKQLILIKDGINPTTIKKDYNINNNYTKVIKDIKDIPNSFDWRTAPTPAVTNVKDQGFAGTCWAFSTIGSIEGQFAIAGNELTSLSPEFLVDCDGDSDEVNNHADCSVFGGWPYIAYGYIIERGGLPSEAEWPYCSGNGQCAPCMNGPVSLCGPPPYSCDRTIDEKCKDFTNTKPYASISSWISVSEDEEIIASTLYSQGPLSVLLDASQLQFYKSGILPMYLFI
jgi:cathepsin F